MATNANKMQQIQIIGNLGLDAEIKNHNGNEFITFSVAINRNYKKQDGTEVEESNWYNCLSSNVKIAKFLKKGTKVFVQGDVSTSVYKAKTGEHRVSLDIRCDKIQLLSPKKEDVPIENNAVKTDNDDLAF